MVFSVNTYAVHDIDVFELDNGQLGANAIDETDIGNADASAPDDWAKVGGCPNGLASCGYVSGPTVDPDNPGGSAFKSLFIQDPNGVANTDDIFTGGGSKDDLDVKQWLTKRGSTPDKDDLLPIGAAAYLEDMSDDGVDNPDLLIYLFGSLFAPNGSAAIGAWLFKKDIGICDDGIGGADTDPFGVVDGNGNCLPPAQQPINLHTIGDVFVVAENVNGGRVVIMEVYKWVDENTAGGQDTAAATAAKAACTSDGGTLVNGTLCRVFADEDAHCDSVNLANDDACGTMNLGETKGQNAQPGVPTESPDDWGFQSKFPPAAGPASPPGTDGIQSNDFPPTSLFEAGFNFTNLFPEAIGCFNTFLMNTRASHSVDATLKDIGMGKFPLCGISVSKSGPEKSKIGDDADFTFTITNTGAITLYLDTVVDDVLGDLETAAVAEGCATLAAQASCEFTVTRPIPDGSPDPLVNTVTVHYNSAQSLQGDDQTSTASHSTNLFQPSITFDKTGDALSKATDTTNYTITLNNTSSADTPDLVCTITDPLLNLDEDVTLASGASHVINTNYVVQAGDSDPLLNTASVTCSPTGFPNIYTASDGHSTNLFQPSITLDKTGSELSKVGDPVDYTITLSNTSSADSPALDCTVSDALLGIDEAVTLAAGEQHVINAQYTVQAGDADPLPNTASATCSPQGFPNVLAAEDSHSVNLFQPSVVVVKEGDALSKVGDPASYTITVTNTSSADSPNLVNGTIVDTLLGDLLAANQYVSNSSCTGTLATGASCVIQATRTVQVGDPDPLPNTVTVHYNPSGFPNDITDSDDHSVNLFQPSVAVDKTANCDLDVIVGQTITYSYTINNTGSTDSPNLNLASIVDDKLGDLAAQAAAANCNTLASGASCNFTVDYVTQATDVGAPIVNTVDVHYNPAGFPNDISDQDDQSCNVVLPNPATVVIEKLLLNAENLAFSYSTTGDLPPSFFLTPLYGQLPLTNSPFADPLAGQSFASSIEYTVDIPSFGATEQVSVTEDEPLPPFISAVSLTCAAADGGSLTGQSVAGLTATLTLGSGDYAFCRYVNQFNPGDEGCTPGYWKQEQHFGSWTNPPYDPYSTQLQDVFNFAGVNGQIGGLADDLMLDALSYSGGTGKLGAAQIMLRAAVAAVLNAANGGVQYAFTLSDVISDVNAQLQSGTRESMLALATQLDDANNGVFDNPDGGESCPLGLNPL
ncbi:hypothetical protein F3I16_01415 [Pseudomonas sp. L-22-4S-12]|uniref:DUF7507 domain-containing protein n=1 Tax=Pseudomonas sp. L-22-4S-12 TaxID=2610893 RepID=UPI001323B0B5|nr:hypothetical protein [Pseudomonas sp. L-22-4S-12]MWV14689.1 hypothetical protein [Pseudomonas sp. L-22-4S-12]